MPRSFTSPRTRSLKIWSEQWQAPEERLRVIETMLRQRHAPVRRGGEYDDWDLEIRGGFFACVRTRLGVEEYPQGRQYLRFRACPRLCRHAGLVITLPMAVAAFAAVAQAYVVAAAFGVFAALILVRALGDCGAAMGCVLATLRRYEDLVNGVAATDEVSTEPRRRPSAQDATASGDMKARPEAKSVEGLSTKGWDGVVAWAREIGSPDILSLDRRQGGGEVIEKPPRAAGDGAAKPLGT
jgi:hypothetical protein